MYMYVYIRMCGNGVAGFLEPDARGYQALIPAADCSTSLVCDVRSGNQSFKILTEPHTSTREATSQYHHTGSKPRVAKRRRMGG